MKRIFMLLVIISFISTTSFATKHKVKRDLKLSYQEYVDVFGKDDTCKAIIEVFFEKRDVKATGKMSFLPVSAGVTIVVPPVGIALMGITTPLFVSGLVTNSRYSHKNLNKALSDYRELGIIKPKIKKHIIRVFQEKRDLIIEEKNNEKLALLKTVGNNK